MSTLIEKNTGQHPLAARRQFASFSCCCCCCSFTGQRSAIAEIARLNYNSAFYLLPSSFILRSLPSPLTCCKQLPQAYVYKKVDEEEPQLAAADTTYQIKTHLMRNKDNRCFK